MIDRRTFLASLSALAVPVSVANAAADEPDIPWTNHGTTLLESPAWGTALQGKCPAVSWAGTLCSDANKRFVWYPSDVPAYTSYSYLPSALFAKLKGGEKFPGNPTLLRDGEEWVLGREPDARAYRTMREAMRAAFDVLGLDFEPYERIMKARYS